MTKQRICALLAALTLCCTPALAQPADDLLAMQQNGAFRPADVGFPAMESYDFPYMGVSLVLPRALLDALENQTVYMTQAEGERSEAGEMTYGLVSWYAMTQADRDTELSLADGDFGAWLGGLAPLGVLGAYHTGLLGELDALTGLPHHEKLAESADGRVHYYLSLPDEVSEEASAQLRAIQITYTDILPYPDSCGVGLLPGDPVLDAEWKTKAE